MTRRLIALLGGVALLTASCSSQVKDDSQVLQRDFLVVRQIDDQIRNVLSGGLMNTYEPERAKSWQLCLQQGMSEDEYQKLLDLGGKVVAVLPETFSVTYNISQRLKCYAHRYIVEAPKSVWEKLGGI